MQRINFLRFQVICMCAYSLFFFFFNKFYERLTKLVKVQLKIPCSPVSLCHLIHPVYASFFSHHVYIYIIVRFICYENIRECDLCIQQMCYLSPSYINIIVRFICYGRNNRECNLCIQHMWFSQAVSSFEFFDIGPIPNPIIAHHINCLSFPCNFLDFT